MTMHSTTSESEDGYATDSSDRSQDVSDNVRSYDSASGLPSHHPFAASTKADRSLPLYEKKKLTPPVTLKEPEPIITPKTNVSRRVFCSNRSQSLVGKDSGPINLEQERWAAVIAAAVDKAETTIDLSGNNLTYIPSSIMDLNDLVVLPKPQDINIQPAARIFARSSTAPALLSLSQVTESREFERTRTIGKLPFAKPRPNFVKSDSDDATPHRVKLCLSQNSIRSLPRELFMINSLVVLILRANKLTSLPPGIGRLNSLRELNIANNRIQVLPSEILNLTLTTLHLNPNPFFPYPLFEHDKPARVLGTLEHDAKTSVPALTELALRILLEPTNSGSIINGPFKPKTYLEEAIPIADIDGMDRLPDRFRNIINASIGHERSRHDDLNRSHFLAEDDVTMNICPNQRHGNHLSLTPLIGIQSRGFQNKPFAAYFHTPMEKRIEWVGIIAGVKVANSRSGWVPIEWRGCSHGCLDFLEQGERRSEVVSVVAFETSKGEDGEEFEFSDEE